MLAKEQRPLHWALSVKIPSYSVQPIRYFGSPNTFNRSFKSSFFPTVKYKEKELECSRCNVTFHELRWLFFPAESSAERKLHLW